MGLAGVAVVDEHDVVRAGVAAWLTGARPALTLVGSFRHSADYLAWLPTATGIDILVTEIRHDGHAPDLESLRTLCAAGPAVVVHSGLTSDEVILSSLDAGASAFVAKRDGREHLIEALTRIGNGQPYRDPRTAAAVDRARHQGRVGLSEREREVLLAWLRTENKDDVAGLLNIAVATVRTHLQRVRAKYADVGRPAATKSALLARAIEDGIIGPGDLRERRGGG